MTRSEAHGLMLLYTPNDFHEKINYFFKSCSIISVLSLTFVVANIFSVPEMIQSTVENLVDSYNELRDLYKNFSQRKYQLAPIIFVKLDKSIRESSLAFSVNSNKHLLEFLPEQMYSENYYAACITSYYETI